MRVSFPVGVVAAAVLGLTVACGGNEGPAAPTPPPPAPSAPAPSSAVTPPSGTTPAPAPTQPPATPAPTACPETASWGTGPVDTAGSTRDALYLVRAGRHDCYDRVVFDINGPGAVGYSARYVPEVAADASGKPIPVPGGAALQVVVRAPAQGFDESGHQPGRVLAAPGDYFYTANQLAGWSSLRAVRFAGFFEGQCTFAVGVRQQLPFRMFTVLDTQSQVRRVVLDIAH